VVCTRRARTNTPLQALVTMNDPQFVEAARKLAERSIKAAPDDAGRINFMARTTISREVSKAEQPAFTKSLETFRGHFSAHPADAAALLTTGESPADASLPAADIATWTMIANQFLNLDEYVNK
jgi:hypothetical protein